MKKLMKIMSGLMSLILSVSLFAVITLSISLFSVKRSFSEDGIKKAVAGIDFSALIKVSGSGVGGNALPLGLLAADFSTTAKSFTGETDRDEDSGSHGSGFEISDELLQKLAQMGIGRAMVEQYLSSDLVKDMAGKLLARYTEGLTEYMLDGETDIAVDGEFLHELFADNMDDIEDLLGVEMSNQEKDQLLDIVDQFAPEIEKSLPAYREIEDSISESSDVDISRIREDYIRPFFAPVSTIIALSVIIGIFALLALLRWSWYKWMIWAGVPMLFSGLAVLSGVFIAVGVINAAISGENSGSAAILRLFRPLEGSLILFSAIAIALAVILIVLYAVFSSMAKKTESGRVFADEAARPAELAEPPQHGLAQNAESAGPPAGDAERPEGR